LQIETSKEGRGGTRYLPYEIRRIVFKQNDLKEQLREVRERLSEHDVQLNHIYDAMENLLDEKAAERKWEQRERIGFRK